MYHVLRDARGPSASTVCRVVHRVAEALLELKAEVVSWPDDCNNLAEQFHKAGGFPSVAGCLDGTHIKVVPPKTAQVDFINRHHTYSLNMLGVAGPDLDFFYANPNFGGRCHDSHVLRSSALWKAFEDQNYRPFPGILCFTLLGFTPTV